MAIVTATAQFYNAFKCRVVDKSFTASLTASFNIAHPDPNNSENSLPDILSTRVLRSPNNFYRTTSSLTALGGFAVSGAVLKGPTGITSSTTLKQSFPTFVEIDWYQLNVPEGKNVTIQMEQGFVIEDRNKFPFALGSPLAFNPNLLTFRTPKRLFGQLTSEFTSNNLVDRIKNIPVAFFAESRVFAIGIFNPGRFAALVNGLFVLNSTIGNVKPLLVDLDSIADLQAVTGYLREFNLVTASEFNITNALFGYRRFGSSELFNSAVWMLTSEQGRVRFYQVSTASNFDLLGLGKRIRGISSPLSSVSNITAVLPKALLSAGNNEVGRTGLGLSTGVTSTFTVADPTLNWKEVDAGINHSVAVKEDGTLWSWGNNGNGRTGLGFTTGITLTPTQVGTATNWSKVAVGDAHSMAIKQDGTLWGWGLNNVGQLGFGNTNPTLTPTQVGTATNWIDVKLGDGYSLVLNSLGEIWSCGVNLNGRTGQGTVSGNTLTLTRIGTATNWSKITAGNTHSLAINSSGELWGWGANPSSQLAPLPNLNVITPTRMGTDTDWRSIAAGFSHSLAIKTNLSLWSWGSNFSGATAQGTNEGTTTTPTQVGTETNWDKVFSSDSHAFAIKTQGSLWAAGTNFFGQLGLSNTISPITSLTQVRGSYQYVGIGSQHSIIISR